MSYYVPNKSLENRCQNIKRQRDRRFNIQYISCIYKAGRVNRKQTDLFQARGIRVGDKNFNFLIHSLIIKTADILWRTLLKAT